MFICGALQNSIETLLPCCFISSLLLADVLSSGDIAALVYLWNPFTIVACVGLSTSAIENMMIVLSLYGGCTRKHLASLLWIFRFLILLWFCNELTNLLPTQEYSGVLSYDFLCHLVFHCSSSCADEHIDSLKNIRKICNLLFL